MKKFISALLIFFMLITSVNVVMAEDNYTDAKSKLVDMGIYKDELFTDGKITRGNFARLLMRFMNLDDTGTVDSARFIDTPVSHKTTYAINALFDMGYTNGYDGYLFKPDANITYPEAIYMVLGVLDYKCTIVGGAYPAAGILKASSFGLLDGFENNYAPDAEMTESDALTLLYNALNTKILERVYSNAGDKWKISDKTAYDAFWEMTIATGVVTANSLTGLYDKEEAAQEGHIRIGNELFKTDNDYTDFLGYTVRCFFTVENGENVIVSLEKTDRNELSQISGADIKGYSAGNIEYYNEDEKVRRIRYSDNGETAVIFNNAACTGYGRIQDLITDDTHISAIDNDGDGVAEVLNLTEYDNYYVSRIDVKNATIADDLNSDSTTIRKICLDEDDAVLRVFDAEGKSIELEDITIGQIAAVAKSRDNGHGSPVVTVYVSSNTVVGKIESTTADSSVNGGIKYYIGSNEYELDKSYNLNAQPIDLRTEGSFYLTKSGKIIARTLSGAKGLVGIIQGLSLKEKGLKPERLIKLYTASGKSEIYTMAKKVRIDDVSTVVNAANLNSSKFDAGNLIMFSLNAAGEIKEITTPKDYGIGKKGEFRKLIESGNKFSVVANVVNGSAAPIEGRTVMLSAPSDPTDDKAYSIIPFSGYKTQLKDKRFDMYSYSDDEIGIIDVLVAYDAAKTMLNDEVTDIYVVNRIFRGLTEDSDVAKMFEVVNPVTASKERLIISDDLTTSVRYTYNNLHGTRIKCVSDDVIEEGDVIRVAKNAVGEVTSIELVWDYNDNDNPDAKLRFSDDNDPTNDYVDSAHYYATGKYTDMGRLISTTIDAASGNFIQYESSLYKMIPTGTDADGNPTFDYTSNWQKLGTHIADSDEWAPGKEPTTPDVETHLELSYINSDNNMIVYDVDSNTFEQIKRADLPKYKGKRCILSISQNLLQKLIIFE